MTFGILSFGLSAALIIKSTLSAKVLGQGGTAANTRDVAIHPILTFVCFLMLDSKKPRYELEYVYRREVLKKSREAWRFNSTSFERLTVAWAGISSCENICVGTYFEDGPSERLRLPSSFSHEAALRLLQILSATAISIVYMASCPRLILCPPVPGILSVYGPLVEPASPCGAFQA
jgi:hypothetical protein